jgi:transcriptional regulator GlxA family with amidase domain
MPKLIRSACLTNYVEVVTAVGLDPYRQLKAAGVEDFGQHLGMDRRTIHRHLASDAETFSSIVHAVRVELATRYLTTTDRPLAEVADCSASAWRAARRGRMVPAR